MQAKIRFILALSLAIALAGCSGEKEDITEGWSAEKLYSEAKGALEADDYETAIDYYEKLESRFPFGPYAQQGQLEIAYAYYKYDEPASAIAAADRFLKLHPQNPNVDYAQYLKGLTNFNEGKGFMDRYLPYDAAERDTASARDAFNDFSELVSKYPDSKYAEDAQQRMLHLRNNLAKHEVYVADFYMRREAFVAAANRAKYVVENFQRTPAVEEALVIMAKAYKILKLDDLSRDALRVLKLNFPNNPGIKEIEALAQG